MLPSSIEDLGSLNLSIFNYAKQQSLTGTQSRGVRKGGGGFDKSKIVAQ